MLEQDLASLSLLLKEDQSGSYEFIHKTWQEYFTAKWFAENINARQISIRDAYINHWSYLEDPELWGLPQDEEWRSVLPAWQPILEMVRSLLTSEFVQSLDDTLLDSFQRAEKIFDSEYNPFGKDNFIKGTDYLSTLCDLGSLTGSMIGDYPPEPDWDFPPRHAEKAERAATTKTVDDTATAPCYDPNKDILAGSYDSYVEADINWEEFASETESTIENQFLRSVPYDVFEEDILSDQHYNYNEDFPYDAYDLFVKANIGWEEFAPETETAIENQTQKYSAYDGFLEDILSDEHFSCFAEEIFFGQEPIKVSPVQADDHFSQKTNLDGIVVAKDNGASSTQDLLQILRESKHQYDIKGRALFELSLRHEPEIAKEALEIYNDLKRKHSKEYLLQDKLLQLLLERNAISPVLFAEDFLKISTKLFRQLQSGVGDPLDNWQFEGQMQTDPIQREEVALHLGKLIRQRFKRSSRSMQLFYISYIKYLEDKTSGPMLLELLDNRTELDLGKGSVGYLYQVNIEALEAIGKIGYTEAAPLLHERLKKRLKEYFSPQTKRLIEKHEKELEKYFQDEEEYHKLFGGEPAPPPDDIETPTSRKINKLAAEIRYTVEALGRLGYNDAMPEIEKIIMSKDEHLFTDEIANGLEGLGTSRAFHSLLELHDRIMGRGLFPGNDAVNYGEQMEKTCHNLEDFRNFVATIRKKGTYPYFNTNLYSIHERLKPQGYNPDIKELGNQQYWNEKARQLNLF